MISVIYKRKRTGRPVGLLFS